MNLTMKSAIVATLLLASLASMAAGEFITKWRFPIATTSISFNAQTTSSAVNYTWTASPSGNSGSGSFTSSVAGAVTLSGLSIAAGDEVILSIEPTNLKRFYTYINVSSRNANLIDVMQWGNVPWTSMDGAFYGCTNLNITATDTPDLSLVTNMQSMFGYCTSLTGNVSFNSWNTSNVTTMFGLFSDASVFNQNIGGWNTGNVTNMNNMFLNARSFNQPIGNWATDKVILMNSMFQGASAFNQPIGNWNTTNVTSLVSTFLNASEFNQPLNNWNTAKVTSLASTFQGASKFNQDIGNWNTGLVTSMNSTFYGASVFNQNIGGWNTGNVTNMGHMFRNAFVFNQNIGGWNTSKVSTMTYMFYAARVFNQDIGNWITSVVTNMSNMFDGATVFDQNIGRWDVSNVTTMSSMFDLATAFNQPIGNWNTGKVTDMSYMFYFGRFNQDISNWNTSKVTTMFSMFEGNKSFNQNIANWMLSSALNMTSMFRGASAFNQNISTWNTASITNMTGMFADATAFDQNLGAWILNPGVIMVNMLDFSGLSCNNYTSTLQGWAANNATVTGRTLGASGRIYANEALPARTTLTTTQGWVILNDFQVAVAPLVLSPSSTVDNTITAIVACDYYVNPSDRRQKLMQFEKNGNTFNPSSVKISNSSMNYTAAGKISYYINNGLATGYSQMTNGGNTLRIGWRMHSIVAPGSYTLNGGIRVRIYYNPNDIDRMRNEPVSGSTINTFGWFKSSKHTALEVLQDMDYATVNLLNATAITPVATGTENGQSYAEFLLTSFSTIGYYASSRNFVLPVKLISFESKVQNCITGLKWTTATEENFSHFSIERSSNGNTFNEISRLSSHNNSTGSSYEYKDESATSNQIYYYRLKMIDIDGKYSYSSVVVSKPDCNSKAVLAIYPNPIVNNTLQFTVSKAGGLVSIIDVQGRNLLTRNAMNTNNRVDISDFAKGTYILEYTVDSQIQRVKFVKQE